MTRARILVVDDKENMLKLFARILGDEYELTTATHMFTGGLDKPPASNITIQIDNPLVAQPDPRPGKDPVWHRSVRTSVSLKITVENNGSPDISSVTGYALFYVVRGDSAVIPPEMVAQGFKPDSTRWWIERWEDETAGASGGPASVRPVGGGIAGRHAVPHSFTLPPGPVTFGEVKASRL